jgi:hypothetical protein
MSLKFARFGVFLLTRRKTAWLDIESYWEEFEAPLSKGIF